MAVAAKTIWEVRSTGSDSACAGGFNPVNGNFMTDLTVTSGGDARTTAPVVKSASYSFVAGDVGAVLFIQAGTNWLPGWYKITAVASNEAAVNATIGSACLASSTSQWNGRTTVAGVASTQTPTGGTFTIDYSQQAAAGATGTVTSVTTTVTATAAIFTKAMVGNYIGDGTTFREIVSFTSSTVVVVDASPSWTTATVYVGGAFVTVGKAFGLSVASNAVFVIAGSYTQATDVALAGPGDPLGGINYTRLYGYNTTRGDEPTGASRPTITAATGCTTLVDAGQGCDVAHLILDCATTIANYGVKSQRYGNVRNCKISNYKINGVLTNSGGVAGHWIYGCEITGGTAAATSGIYSAGGPFVSSNYVHDNACTGIIIVANEGVTGIAMGNICANNSGASSDGIRTNLFANALNNTCYNNGRDGIRSNDNEAAQLIQNNILVSNGGYGVNFNSTIATLGPQGNIDYNFFKSNISGPVGNVFAGIHDVLLSVDPFTNSAGGDFTINSTAGGGAACRSTAYISAFPGGTMTNYEDAGALQAVPTSGGGGGGGTFISRQAVNRAGMY